MALSEIQKEYLKVEHYLRYMIGDIKPNDYFYLDNIKHSMLVFLLKDKINENNEVFLKNMEYEFKCSIDRLILRYPKLKINLMDISDFAMKYVFI